MPRWVRLGSGSYNIAYRDESKTRVLKIQRDSSDLTDSPSRSARVWNEVNPHIPPPATVASTEHGEGWVCPYVEGRQSSDKEMAHGLIDIYSRTGRVVADATAPKNFITMASGQVICIDIGMALRLQQFDTEPSEHPLLERRGSVISLGAWTPGLKRNYEPFFRQCGARYPDTVQTVKALLFIQGNRPDIIDTSFLQDNDELKRKLARAYDYQSADRAHAEVEESLGSLDSASSSASDVEPPIREDRDDSPVAIPGEEFDRRMTDDEEVAHRGLREIRPINLENIKDSCLAHINRYISSRGTIKHDGNFNPSFVTRHFRDELLTAAKVQKMRTLKETISSASSYEDIKTAINVVLKDKQAVKTSLGGGVKRSLERCLSSVAVAENAPGLDDEKRDSHSV